MSSFYKQRSYAQRDYRLLCRPCLIDGRVLVFLLWGQSLVPWRRELWSLYLCTGPLAIKAKNRFLCKTQISACSGYGNRIKLKNNAILDFNEAHLCFFCRSNFWLSSAHSVWTWKFHSSTVCKAMHWSCRKKRWVTEYVAISPISAPSKQPMLKLTAPLDLSGKPCN